MLKRCFFYLQKVNMQCKAFSRERVLREGEVQARPELRQDLQSCTWMLWFVCKTTESDSSCLSYWNLEQLLM